MDCERLLTVDGRDVRRDEQSLVDVVPLVELDLVDGVHLEPLDVACRETFDFSEPPVVRELEDRAPFFDARVIDSIFAE